jgi:hypothetical protein
LGGKTELVAEHEEAGGVQRRDRWGATLAGGQEKSEGIGGDRRLNNIGRRQQLGRESKILQWSISDLHEIGKEWSERTS